MKTLDLNDSPMLPESAESYDSASGGALGGAKKGDLKRGFSTGTVPAGDMVDDGTDSDDDLCASPMDRGGFLGRAQGWER